MDHEPHKRGRDEEEPDDHGETKQEAGWTASWRTSGPKRQSLTAQCTVAPRRTPMP
jgi:hypothetical protein